MIFTVQTLFSLLFITNKVFTLSFNKLAIPLIEVEIEHLKDILPLGPSNNRNFSFEEIVEKRGYPVESHQVTTEDGYILTIYRIPYGRNSSNSTEKRNVVYFQHAFGLSAASWIIPKNALAYMLADEGYDVWLGNARGTNPSRKHVRLDPEKDAPLYWDFSWDEIGFYDVPAMIDYVLTYTDQKKLFHVGHSQGTTTLYSMTSLRPEINDKIIAHFSLSPVVFWKDAYCPIFRIAALFETQINSLYPMIGLYDLFKYCGNVIPQELCTVLLYVISGFNSKQFDTTLFPLIAANSPAGSATKQLIHYIQLINSDRFRRFDYGKEGNLKKFGSETPPDYDLSKVTVPIYLFYSSDDWLAAESDVFKLAEILPNFKEKFLIPDETWSHLDFVYGKEIDRYINLPIIKIMSRH